MGIFCDKNNPNSDSAQAPKQSSFGRVVIHCGWSRDFEGEYRNIYEYKGITNDCIWIDCNQTVKAIQARFTGVCFLLQRRNSC